MKRELLRIENLVKKDKSSEVLSGLYMHLFADETLGVICDSLYEKHSLLDLLSGGSFDSGRVYLNDRRLDPDDQKEAFEEQIAIIGNRKTLSRNLSVAENMFVISSHYDKYIVTKKKIWAKASALLMKFNIGIGADELVQHLSTFEYTVIEIVKAYAKGCRLMVLSDLTSFLSTLEIEKLYKLVRQLKKNGIAFLILEDYEDVLFHFSDRLMVMHNGKSMRTLYREDFNRETMATLLMETIEDNLQAPDINSLVNKTLMFRNVCTRNLRKADFTVHKGEIVNLLCMDERSYQDVISLLQGDLRPTIGEVVLNGKRYVPYSNTEAIQKGVCFISENPINNMLFYDMSVLDNLCFSMGNKLPTIWMKRNYRKNIAQRYNERLDGQAYTEKLDDLHAETLQKLVYSKWHLYSAKVVVCMKPFSTVGLHLRKVTKDLIHDYAQKGIAVLIITSNIAEAYYTGNKVVVLEKGKIIGEENTDNGKNHT